MNLWCTYCVRSEPWYWWFRSLNLPGSSWIFLPKATQTTTQPLDSPDTSAPVAQHFWWAQVDSSAAGPWDQMNFDHGDDRLLVLNLHQMPALFHNCITRTGWLPLLLRNPVLILRQHGPFLFQHWIFVCDASHTQDGCPLIRAPLVSLWEIEETLFGPVSMVHKIHNWKETNLANCHQKIGWCVPQIYVAETLLLVSAMKSYASLFKIDGVAWLLR